MCDTKNQRASDFIVYFPFSSVRDEIYTGRRGMVHIKQFSLFYSRNTTLSSGQSGIMLMINKRRNWELKEEPSVRKSHKPTEQHLENFDRTTLQAPAPEEKASRNLALTPHPLTPNPIPSNPIIPHLNINRRTQRGTRRRPTIPARHPSGDLRTRHTQQRRTNPLRDPPPGIQKRPMHHRPRLHRNRMRR